MTGLNYKKLSLFLVTTTILSCISFLTRNVIISNFNNYNFKLFTVDYVKNFGAAFSILHTHTSVLLVISTAILLLTLYYIFLNLNKLSNLEFIFSIVVCCVDLFSSCVCRSVFSAEHFSPKRKHKSCFFIRNHSNTADYSPRRIYTGIFFAGSPISF